ncbi:MAG TPA: glycosyltransferase [Kiritimatiellia bacterium]|nr:glycosyltransferase [Kiritimatiellia bacterium]HMP95926.1 glycosyltransferase [Kiritimatiellia bacterium]
MMIVFFMQDTGAIFGAERATLDLAIGLREAGFSPHFYLIEELRRPQTAEGLVQAVATEGFPMRRFPVTGRFSPGMARAVRQAFVEDGGEVLHVVGSKANLHAWFAGIRPRVATVHGWLFRADLKERLYDALDRMTLRRCDRVICLSTYYRDLVARFVPAERLSFIPSGLRVIPDEAAIPPRPRSSEAVVFGMMGRFSEEKQHERFLQAAGQITGTCPSARFVLAGQGPREGALRDLTERLGLTGRVTFPGYQPPEVFFKHIDAYVICSRIENLPYSILEAMAWAVPVAGTRVGGIPDLVIDGETGSLVSRDDASALAGVLRRWAEHPHELTAFGQAGRRRLLSHFDLATCARAHQTLYRSLRIAP